jgi:exopolyphosphatase / guanosine-5'-triphosphate,3'-diphosphate pyrophosphatase
MNIVKMKSERIAVIDLGTNTFHLLIAETNGQTITPLHSEKTPVRIGKGGINHGFITDEACERALKTMKDFKEKIDTFNTKKIYATATSAFRNAKNGIALAEKIKTDTGIEISIITGDLEAELIYDGVKEALQLEEQQSLIIDIGGGSVEFILANHSTILWKQSFEIGGQRLMELFQKTDPIQEGEINALREYLSEKLKPLFDQLSQYPASTLVGSAGSFETLSEIDLLRKGFNFSIESQKEYDLLLSDFHSIYQELVTKDRTSRMKIPGMIELRVDMIVVAVVLIHFIVEQFSIKRLRVSTYSLKEGVMSRIIKGRPLQS